MVNRRRHNDDGAASARKGSMLDACGSACELMPPELIQCVMTHLSFADRCRASGVSTKWRAALLDDKRLWTTIVMMGMHSQRHRDESCYDDCVQQVLSRAHASLRSAVLHGDTLTVRGIAGLSACSELFSLRVRSKLLTAGDLADCLPPKDECRLYRVRIAGCTVSKTDLDALCAALPEHCDLDVHACAECDTIEVCSACAACRQFMCSQCTEVACSFCETAWCNVCVPDGALQCHTCGALHCEACSCDHAMIECSRCEEMRCEDCDNECAHGCSRECGNCNTMICGQCRDDGHAEECSLCAASWCDFCIDDLQCQNFTCEECSLVVCEACALADECNIGEGTIAICSDCGGCYCRSHGVLQPASGEYHLLVCARCKDKRDALTTP